MGVSKYRKMKAGEWGTPVREKYHFACCDCGLVHVMDFRLVPSNHGAGRMIQLRAFRDERATAAMRRRRMKLNRVKR